jgi:predicted NBD/HSP70 family sugar kinase
LEAYVSTAALIREYAERGGSFPDGQAADDASLALEINKLSVSGCPTAVAAYQAIVGYLAEGVANIFNLFDPEAVLISGGLVEGQSQFAAALEERVTELLHFGSKRKPCVNAAAAGRFAGRTGRSQLDP